MLPAEKMRSLFGWNTQSGHAPLVKTPAGTAVELDVVVTIARTNRNGRAGDLAKDEYLAMNSNGTAICDSAPPQAQPFSSSNGAEFVKVKAAECFTAGRTTNIPW
jgi:hypothetical protein